MSKADEIRREQRLADEARPEIVRLLREGAEPAAIAGELAERLPVDDTKAYRWAAYIAEDSEIRRRRIATAGLLMLWPGAIVLAGGPLLSLLGVWSTLPLWLYGLAIGLPLTGAGAWIAARSRSLVRETV